VRDKVSTIHGLLMQADEWPCGWRGVGREVMRTGQFRLSLAIAAVRVAPCARKCYHQSEDRSEARAVQSGAAKCTAPVRALGAHLRIRAISVCRLVLAARRRH
jgi:hypothetical protein